MTASLKELLPKVLSIGRIDSVGISQWIGDGFDMTAQLLQSLPALPPTKTNDEPPVYGV